MSRIIVAPAAEADVIEISAYIAAENRSAADHIIARFEKVFQTIATQPQSGRSAKQLGADLRCASIGSFLVFYRPTESSVEVARILHAARDITPEFFGDA